MALRPLMTAALFALALQHVRVVHAACSGSISTPIDTPLVVASGGAVTLTGTFHDVNRCFFWFENSGYQLYEPAASSTASTVTCTLPSLPAGAPACSTVHVSVQSYPTGEPSPESNTCFTHRGKSPDQWATDPDVTYAVVQYDCGSTAACANTPTLAVEAVPNAGLLDSVGQITVNMSSTVADTFGTYSNCLWFRNGVMFAWVTATDSNPMSVSCQVPSATLAGVTDCDTVQLVVQSYSTGDNSQDDACFSHGLYSSSHWTSGDYVSVQFGTDCCSPSITFNHGVDPAIQANPGDAVTVSGSFHDEAACFFWFNNNAYELYQAPTAVSSTSVTCIMPALPSGASDCETVYLSIQSWHSGDPNKQNNECFTHWGKAPAQWPSDPQVTWAEVQYMCDDGCLDGPFGMVWSSTGSNILVTNEGAGGGGGSDISEVAGPTHADPGSIVDHQYLTGFDGPSGIVWEGSDLVISDDQSGGSIWRGDATTPFTATPGGNPNALRINAAGDIFAAHAGGYIAKYSSSGSFQCRLAEGVNTPQAVEILDSVSEVYFTDYDANVFTVSMTCPTTVPDCTTSDCDSFKVDAGAQAYPAHTGHITEGGLNLHNGKLYIGGYNTNSVIEYDISTSTASECFNGVSQARGILLSPTGSELYVTSYDTGDIYVYDLSAGCGNAPSKYTNCQPGSGSGSGTGSDECVPEEAGLFWYNGVVVTKDCKSGCDPNNYEIELPDGTRYYRVGLGTELGLEECKP